MSGVEFAGLKWRIYIVAVVLTLAGVTAFLLREPVDSGPADVPLVRSAITEEVAAAVIAPYGTQAAPTLSEGVTPELVELMKHGLPIEGCDERNSALQPDRVGQDFQEIARKAADVLAQSDDPEYLLAAALFDFNRDESAESELLSRALAQLPDHPVALWHRMQHCPAESCDRDKIARAAVAADPTNGMLWLEIASEHVEAGDWAEAERAMRRAISSSRFDTYFYDYTMLIERGLAASTDFTYPERVVTGIGVAAAVAIPAFGEVVTACASGDNDAVVWVPLCDELGRSMQKRSREVISTMIGWGYRRVAAERAGDTELAARLERESDAFVDRYTHRQIRVGASTLMENDATVLRNYLDDFRAHGELGAIDRLVEVAERLRNDDTYDQCNFVKRSAPD